MAQGTFIFETKHLILRPFQSGDIKSAHENWLSKEEVFFYMGFPASKQYQESETYITERLSYYISPYFYDWCIVEKESNECIGEINAVRCKDHQGISIGYCLGPDYWHKGYMLEALKKVTYYFFYTEKYSYMEAECDSNNQASLQLLKKLGFKKESQENLYRLTKKPIQIIFFDIDDTLLSHTTNTVSKKVKEAIERLQKKGISIVACSGRNPKELTYLTELQDIAFDGFILMNGSLNIYHDQIVSTYPITEKDKELMLQEAKCPFAFVLRDNLLINRINEDVIEAQSAIHTPIPEVQDLQSWKDEMVFQMIAYPKEKELEPVLKQMEDTYPFYWHTHGVDLMSYQASKGKGIKDLLNYLNLSYWETMAFGDEVNDLAMFAEVFVSVAMGNGTKEAKEMANYITKDIDEDGVYDALEKLSILS